MLLGIAAMSLALAKQWERAPEYTKEAVYPRVDSWIESATCSQLQGGFLLLCSKDAEGNYLPLENLSYGDDRGHALIGNVLSWFKEGPVNRLTFVHVNLTLNALGIAALAVATYPVLPLISVLILLLGAAGGLNVSYMSADVVPAQIGISGFALAAVVWWACHARRKELSLRLWLTGSTLSALSLGFSMMLREPIGRAAEIACILVMLLLARDAWKAVNKRQRVMLWKRLATFIVLLIAQHFATSGLILLRNRLYKVAPSEYSQTHGISHNLYMGLGAVPNSFGIEYDDGFAYRAAKKEDPGSEYLTERHFKALWKVYFRTVKSNPREALRVYLAKLPMFLELEVHSPLLIWHCALISLLLTLAIWFLLSSFPLTELAAFYCFFTLFYLQGLLTEPKELYLLGGRVIAVFLPLFLLGLLARRLQQKIKN